MLGGLPYIGGMKYTIERLAEILDAADVHYREWTGRETRLYVTQTPNGGRGDYGYLVEGGDVRDVTSHISKRSGEISAILYAEAARVATEPVQVAP